MKMQIIKSLSKFFCAVLLITLMLPARGQTQRRRPATPAGNSTVVFVVAGEGDERWMNSLVSIEGGQYKDPSGEMDLQKAQPFASKYFRPGQKYRLLFGGGEAGTVTVKQAQEGCNNISAKVDVDSSTRIGGHVMALATNSDMLGHKPSARRAPTDAERAALMELVKSIYRQKGTTAAALRKLETVNLTATDLYGDSTFELVGSFRLSIGDSVKGSRRDLFIIARPEGDRFKAELAQYQAYQLVDGFGRGVDFVDQLDLDGDGTGEIVTIDEGYDGFGYSIYKKRQGVWRRIFSAAGDAC